MKYTRGELIDRLSRSHSWKEARVSVQDVYDVVSQTALDDSTKIVPDDPVGLVKELREKIKEQDDTIAQLNEKIKRLSDTNKQLRSENKALRSSR